MSNHVVSCIHTQEVNNNNKEEHTMFNIFKKQTTTTYKVTYKFIDEDEVFTITATSAGLASLDADWAVEILEVVKA
jgi:hypothetical protein